MVGIQPDYAARTAPCVNERIAVSMNHFAFGAVIATRISKPIIVDVFHLHHVEHIASIVDNRDACPPWQIEASVTILKLGSLVEFHNCSKTILRGLE